MVIRMSLITSKEVKIPISKLVKMQSSLYVLNTTSCYRCFLMSYRPFLDDGPQFAEIITVLNKMNYLCNH